ncbi:MAG: hypothetical protein KF760_20355 [Candidatus Eremiobacteraeota bacterium]|nr:hypothetical protein [Candidatus Eremiobacteraeota bacterium]MCW5872176.1 hypothetical protein [Candidatus Eremiobacteraeota bacterium]
MKIVQLAIAMLMGVSLGLGLALAMLQAQNARTARSPLNAAQQARLSQLMQLKQRGGTAFLGDSLTENFPLDQYFQDSGLVNLGLSGDTIGGAGPLGCLERLDQGVTQLQPERIVLLIGINDLLLSRYEDGLGAKLDRYEALEIRLRKRLPQAQLCLVSLLPTSGEFAYVNPEILVFNQQIRRLAERDHALYIDAYQAFGKLSPDDSPDGMHLSPLGYRRLAETYARALGLKLRK